LIALIAETLIPNYSKTNGSMIKLWRSAKLARFASGASKELIPFEGSLMVLLVALSGSMAKSNLITELIQKIQLS